ncbi:MAG TPA: ATP synthase F1 subunit gamma [Candidatus Saccharimonadales bacterium]|nr:ATP synthase F1 subunit gamma [Candidatus Saccharimonadales bacterium]
MANTIVLKRRIASIRNMRQITKAMQMVSASKLRRAQDYAARSRAYGELAYELLARLSTIREVEQHPLFARRDVKRRMYVIITSNSGLAGAYNANVLKQLTRGITADHSAKIDSRVIAVGTKGAQFVRRLSGVELAAVYPAFGDQPTANDVRPMLNTIIEAYETGEVDEVTMIYTRSKSSISQEVHSLPLLPAQVDKSGQTADVPPVSNFEPDIETVIKQAATRLVEAEIWQAVLEGLASEHAMRMVAMKNATDNANDLIDDYTLEFNTARQAAITQELAEITGGAEALND